ncbi:MAG: hypothetical protein CME31_11135 [Gimesia sp.]|uniref:Uncharacterized protein n=1 Tax=Gimesia maris TaxID=122 RepID=A0A3D3RET2_9PLAN|nr:hypothetical protein [Gimesia sp.]HCO26602.1 hypothetical protein [Gimesia maris]
MFKVGGLRKNVFLQGFKSFGIGNLRVILIARVKDRASAADLYSIIVVRQQKSTQPVLVCS